MSQTTQSIVEPLYIVPVLVEQPTWGGKYIAEFKNIEDQTTQNLNIGQSYELYKDSLVYTGEFQPIFQLGKAGKTDSLETYNASGSLTSLSDAVAHINQNLGIQSAPAWPLIKFTQAQENSYQAHVKPDTKTNWLPKPESWYFFEEGYATLGLTQETCKSTSEYKKRCIEIDTFAQEISKEVQNGTRTLAKARQELSTFIEENHPRKFVNSVRIPKNATVDLSQGGVHHSWEAHTEIPDGNIVYEVQQDVADNDSTLRSFDQSKIKDDGSVRPLTINDYFTYLDTSIENNNPQAHIAVVDSGETQRGEKKNIFNTPYYKLDEYAVANSHTIELRTKTFQHLFVKEGAITITFQDKQWLLPKGWSILLPPQPDTSTKYTVTSERAVLLVTTE
jgi:mannose-6-phosphate isomerase class I